MKRLCTCCAGSSGEQGSRYNTRPGPRRSFFRWVRMTLPIVKTVPCGSGRFLSPAMSRLLLFLLEAQGGNAPMLRLLERVLRLQEQVRQLARALQRQEGAPVAPPPGHNPDRLDRLALDQERHALADQRL